MCQQIVQFCSASTKPLVFAGSCLTLLLALGLGYLACSANSLYQDIDPSVAQSRSLAYHLQLLASAYLILISVLACFAAHYDQKHSIRALAALTSLNFLLAVAAILMVSSGNSAELGNEFKARLAEAQSMYDFKLKPATLPPANQTAEAGPATAPAPLASTGQRGEAGRAKLKRTISAEASGEQAPPTVVLPLNGTVATNLWDALQARGCCGFTNSTEWSDKLPKSCCSAPEEEKDGNWICKAVDEQHQRPCIRIIESASLNTKNMAFLLLLALIALVNLYLANVTAISAYRTLHYNEASQSAYT